MTAQTAEYQHTQARAEFITRIRQLPGVIKDLEVTLTMQSKSGGGPGGGGSPREKMAYHLKASELLDSYRPDLTRLCQIIDHNLGRPDTERGMVDMAKTAAAHATWLADHLRVEEWVTDLVERHRESLRIRDRPAERTRLGVCDCGVDLTATATQKTIRCRCGLEWDANELRAYVRDRARNLVRQSTDTAKLVQKFWGYKVSRDLIRVWVARGKLATELDAEGNRTYRIGDVVATYEQMNGLDAA